MADQRTIANLPAAGSVVTVGATGATVLASNAGRSGFAIQNQGTGPLFVFLGGGATNNGLFHIILKGGTTPSDGNGATFSMLSEYVYTGVVSAAGTVGLLTVLEL